MKYFKFMKIMTITIVCLNLIPLNAVAEKNASLSTKYWLEATIDEVQNEIKKGVNLNAQNKNGLTVLMIAVANNPNPQVIKLLIKAGANPNVQDRKGVTALMIAAANRNNSKFVKILIENGANPNTGNNDKATALMFAAGYNANPHVIITLFKEGADINLRNKHGASALNYLQLNKRLSQSIELIDLLTPVR